MSISRISFLSKAEVITTVTYEGTAKVSTLLAEIVGRIAAALFLSLGAALDIAFHTALLLPTCLFSIGKSICVRRFDFSLPWEHLQRVRNAVLPLILGSALGVIHPYAGIAVSEPTDKHAAVGILAAHKRKHLHTPCSPVHSLEIIADTAKANRYVETSSGRKEIFTDEHITAIQSARGYEKNLQSLQAQEFVYKLTNITLFVMAAIKLGIENSGMNGVCGQAIIRFSGVLVPVLTAIDLAIALLVQGFFLITGAVRWITNRGPLYTEVTTNPLMHAGFLIQTILKTIGNLLGTLVWFVSPIDGFKVSLLPSNLFFKMQMAILMSRVKGQMQRLEENKRFMIPVAFLNGTNDVLSIPTASMHKTYLIVEKTGGLFNLYWVNRPQVTLRKNVGLENAGQQIRSMFDERFPFMDIQKLMDYPVKSSVPVLKDSQKFMDLHEQGTTTNCVVSNLFGALETLDKLQGEDRSVAECRYHRVRESLSDTYSYYKSDFHPWAEDFTLNRTWGVIAGPSNDSI